MTSRLLRVCALLLLAAAAWVGAPVHAHEGHGHVAAIARPATPAPSPDSTVAVRSQVVPAIETPSSCPDPDGGCCSCRHARCGFGQPHVMGGAPLAWWYVELAPAADASVLQLTYFVATPRAQRAHGARAPPLTQS